jgi:hypothetical protein
MEFEQFINAGKYGLSEGTIYERLRRIQPFNMIHTSIMGHLFMIPNMLRSWRKSIVNTST